MPGKNVLEFYKEIECETKSVKQALIVTFSFKYQDYQHKLMQHQFERAKKLVDEVNKKYDVDQIEISYQPRKSCSALRSTPFETHYATSRASTSRIPDHITVPDLTPGNVAYPVEPQSQDKFY